MVHQFIAIKQDTSEKWLTFVWYCTTSFTYNVPESTSFKRNWPRNSRKNNATQYLHWVQRYKSNQASWKLCSWRWLKLSFNNVINWLLSVVICDIFLKISRCYLEMCYIWVSKWWIKFLPFCDGWWVESIFKEPIVAKYKSCIFNAPCVIQLIAGRC